MLNKSESIANLVKALSALQGELKDSSKNAVNPHYKSKYSDLAEVLGNLRPLLAKNQLALSQFPLSRMGLCPSLLSWLTRPESGSKRLPQHRLLSKMCKALARLSLISNAIQPQQSLEWHQPIRMTMATQSAAFHR